MSIEASLKKLIAEAVAEALVEAGVTTGGGKGAASDDAEKGTSGRGRGRSSTKTDSPKYTAEDVKAAAVKVKEELGTKTAKDLIKKHGADELAKLKPDAYADFIADCEKALKGEDGGAGDDDDGL